MRDWEGGFLRVDGPAQTARPRRGFPRAHLPGRRGGRRRGLVRPQEDAPPRQVSPVASRNAEGGTCTRAYPPVSYILGESQLEMGFEEDSSGRGMTQNRNRLQGAGGGFPPRPSGLARSLPCSQGLPPPRGSRPRPRPRRPPPSTPSGSRFR